MSIIISHNSALEYLRGVPPQVRGDNVTTHPVEVPLGVGRDELARLNLREIGLRQQPVHLVTSRDGTRVRSHGVTPHRTSLGEVPSGLLLEAGNGIYVCGPELVFIQLVSHVSTLGSIVLGYELCGSYSQFAPLVSGFYDRSPLTTREQIMAASQQLRGTNNVRRAREVLPLVLEGSASPMETVTSNVLFLPEDMGGLSLVMPVLNYEVQLDDVARKITGTKTCVIDGAWPWLNRGVEYNGSDHTDPVKDRNRLEALAHMDYTIYTVDANRMMVYSELKKVTDLISSDIPRRDGFSCPREADLKRLHKRLLTATRCGLGLDSVLFGVSTKGFGIRTHL